MYIYKHIYIYIYVYTYKYDATCCSVSQCVAPCCTVLQHNAVWCSASQCVAVCYRETWHLSKSESCMCWRKRERERERETELNLKRQLYGWMCSCVFQFVAVWVGCMAQCVAVCMEGGRERVFSVQGRLYISMCCRVSQCATVSYSVLQCAALCCSERHFSYSSGGSMHCSAVQCAIVCYSVLQRVAAC